MDESKIRYFAEKYLESPLPISVAAFSEGCTYLALGRGPRVTIVATSNALCDPIYFQDSDSDVTALLWLSDSTLIAGYSNGMFVTTRIAYTHLRVQGQALGLRAFPDSSIVVILKGPSRNRLVLASENTVQLWCSSWVSQVQAGPPRWFFDKQLALPANQPIFALSPSYRSPKDIFIVHSQGIVFAACDAICRELTANSFIARHAHGNYPIRTVPPQAGPKISAFGRVRFAGRCDAIWEYPVETVQYFREWDVRNSKHSEIFKQPLGGEIVRISGDGRRWISVVQQGVRRTFKCLDMLTGVSTHFSVPTLDERDVANPNDKAATAFAHDDRFLLLGSSCSDRLILWELTTSNKEVLRMIHDCASEDPRAALSVISGWIMADCVYFRIHPWSPNHHLGSVRIEDWHARQPSASLAMRFLRSMYLTTVGSYKRVEEADIPTQFLPLYCGKRLTARDVLLLKKHVSSQSIPDTPSPTFTVDVDLVWQFLLKIQHLFMAQAQHDLAVVAPCLISWCLYFLKAIPLQTLDSVEWPEMRHLFALIPCLLRDHKHRNMSTSSTSQNAVPLDDMVSTMLKISVKVALLPNRESLKIHGRIENVFHVLYVLYPEIDVDHAISRASKDVTDANVKELASRLAVYVIDKPRNLPIKHVVQLLTCLSKRSNRVHDCCLQAHTPRWAPHVFRVATDILCTRKDEWTVYAIDAVATYLSWLFISQTQTGKVVQMSLSRKLLSSLLRCIDHDPKVWMTLDEALPVATLLKYLGARIMVCPTTGRKAQAALSRIEVKRDQSREDRLLGSKLPEQVASKSALSEADCIYRDLWAAWDFLLATIEAADIGEESCVNPQVSPRSRDRYCALSFI
ncbi:hypothetical protein BDZ89DRAFT_1047066 [Hymenopellis radicata]|nr:hypothetical protein BDZ89DRAFT_1047066 [Hymenopellis radicata]